MFGQCQGISRIICRGDYLNNIDKSVLNTANTAIAYNIFLYLLTSENARNGDKLSDIAADLKNMDTSTLKEMEKSQFEKRVEIIQNACMTDPALANSVIGNIAVDYNNKNGGMKACTFVHSTGTVYVIFAGTGSGEWIDNGEGLSGIPEYNLYEKYDKFGQLLYTDAVEKDYATDQQAEALNWFSRVCGENGWNENTRIIISGHSKGGNKAQFVTINSRFADMCISFDGQGFSPEAVTMFKNKFGKSFEERRRKIYSFSTDNDFVNVLGKPLAPAEQIYFLKSSDISDSPFAYHYVETLTDTDGRLNEQNAQGDISQYMQNLSDTIMAIEPSERQYITLSIMSILQRILGNAVVPVNGDFVSTKDTVKGIIMASAPTLLSLLFTKDGKEAAADIGEIYMDNITRFIDKTKKEQGDLQAAAAAIFSQTAVMFISPFLSHKKRTDISELLSASDALNEKLNKLYLPIYAGIKPFFKNIAEKLKGQ